ELGAATSRSAVIVRMVNAIARTTPTVNMNLAGFGFGAMYASWRQIRCCYAGLWRGKLEETYELLHTSLRQIGSVFEMSHQSNFRNHAVVEKVGVSYLPNRHG